MRISRSVTGQRGQALRRPACLRDRRARDIDNDIRRRLSIGSTLASWIGSDLTVFTLEPGLQAWHRACRRRLAGRRGRRGAVLSPSLREGAID